MLPGVSRPGREPAPDFSQVERLHIHGKFWAPLMVSLALTAPLATAGCGPARDTKAARGEQLPEFTPEEAALFDDAFSAGVFSSEIAFDADDKLYLRTRRAEAVIPAVIATVTEDQGSDGQHVFTVALRPVGPAFAGQSWRDMVVVEVGTASPSYAVLQTMGRSLVGTPVVLFFRRYKEDRNVVVHWRAEPAREEVRQAVERARTSGEIGK